MYSDILYKNLAKISNTFETEAGIKLSFTSLTDYLCEGWANDEKGKKTISLSGGMAWKNKMTSKGTFAKALQNNVSQNLSSKLYPALGKGKLDYCIATPFNIVSRLNKDYLSNTMKQISSRLSGNYPVKDALKIESQYTEKAEIKGSFPLLKFSAFGQGIDVTFDCGLGVDIAYYPDETYYSVSDEMFCPVVIRDNQTLASMLKQFSTWISNGFNDMFDDDEKEEICLHAKGKNYANLISVAQDKMEELTNKNRSHYMGGGGGSAWVKRRAPRLYGVKQEDICTFSFKINDGNPNFSDGTNVHSSHFYPMGKLLGITNQNDTLFVVSELFTLSALEGNDTLKTTKSGTMNLETHVGADDLTPFCLSLDTPIGVYYSEEGKDIWEYVGDAGTTLNVNKLGLYMMATSIKNDLTAPSIYVDFFENPRLLCFEVSDNIAIRMNSMTVYVNGEARDIVMTGPTSFEVKLTEDDMNYRLNVVASIYDLAGNKGEIMQVFQTDKPVKVVTNGNQTDITDISALDNVIYIDPMEASAGSDVTLSVNMKNTVPMEGFSFDLYLPEGMEFQTDEDGFPETYLSTQRTTARKTNTFEAAIQADGALRVFAASTNGSTINGNDGEVVTVKTHVDTSMENGLYPLIIRQIALSDSNARSYDTAEVVCSIQVGTTLTCDVNQDGNVDISDIVAVINTMAGDNQFRATADANGDNSIDISDVVAIINYMAGSAAPTPTPKTILMEVSSSSMDFGSIEEGNNRTITFTITSSGTSSLTISSVSLANGVAFNVDASKCVLSPGESRTLKVTFKPTEAGEYNDRIIIRSDADDNSQWVIQLTGTGTASEEEVYLTCPDSNHPHVIDMGAAGKWACCNVGASAPELYGGYFTWGETEGRIYYDWSTYNYCDGTQQTCHDIGDDIAGTNYDVAHVDRKSVV